MPNLVKPQDTHCVCNRKQNIMSDYISQTITVSSCQSDISNQCRIKTPCITGMDERGGGLDGTHSSTWGKDPEQDGLLV